MKGKLSKILISLLFVISLAALAGCASSVGGDGTGSNEQQSNAGGGEQVVNLYTDRHYDTDEELYKAFTAETGVKVNVVKGKSDELIERLKREGKDTEADLLITADAGRLYRAKEEGLLQAVDSATLKNSIPENLRDPDNQWFGLTVRARVIVYSKDRVKPSELSTYEDLTNPKWKGKILVRSSSNIYNQSLLASFIAIKGEEWAKNWAKGIVANMAREPEGNDTDQAIAVAAGQGDLAIMNTYYFGRLLNSSDPEQKKIGESLGVFFPDQDGAGTHINVSGIGLTKESKNKENAIKFMEFLASEKAQKQFAESNFEYPVNPNVESAELLKSWGEFKTQNINLSKLGELNSQAVKIFDEVGWK
jgi:iron(III) transport system substrate-binding protein